MRHFAFSYAARRRIFQAALPLCAFVLLAPAFANASTAGFDTPTDPPTRTMPFNIEGVEGMRLWTQNDTNGPIYLGIGTTLPLYPLHVIGEAAIGYEPNSSGGLIFTPSATYGNPAMQSVTSLFLTSPLLLNPVGGGVGIGTAVTPAAALDINGAVRATGSTIVSGTSYLIEVGQLCSPEGAIGYDKTSTTHQLVYCPAGSSAVWTVVATSTTRVWNNVRSGRSVNGVTPTAQTNYYVNTHGYPIEVSASLYFGGGTVNTLQIYVGQNCSAANLPSTMIQQSTNLSNASTVSVYATIPPNWCYSLGDTNNVGTGVPQAWYELY